MLLSTEEANLRLESPENLINRLRRKISIPDARILPPEDKSETRMVVLPPSVDDLVDNLDSKLKLSSMQEKAVDIINDSMTLLKERMSEVPTKSLSHVAADMSKIISNIREQRGMQTNNIQVMIYAPEVRSEREFEVIDIQETA